MNSKAQSTMPAREHVDLALQYEYLYGGAARCAVCGKSEEVYGANILYEDPRGWACCYCLEEEGK